MGDAIRLPLPSDFQGLVFEEQLRDLKYLIMEKIKKANAFPVLVSIPVRLGPAQEGRLQSWAAQDGWKLDQKAATERVPGGFGAFNYVRLDKK